MLQYQSANVDWSMSRLDSKDSYEELTPKQAAIVDTKARHPEYGPKQLAEEASKQLDDDTVSRSYVRPILQNYGHIIEERREQLDNQRYQGEEQTVGDPFEGQLGDSEGWQGIKDRPEKARGESNNNFISVRVWQDDLEELLQGNVPDEFKQELLKELTQKAFD